MRFLNMLFGGLLGAVPGVLLMAIGQIVTNGGEVMLEIGFGGVLLSVVGLTVGAVLGWQKSGWLNSLGVLGAAIGLMPGVIMAGPADRSTARTPAAKTWSQSHWARKRSPAGLKSPSPSTPSSSPPGWRRNGSLPPTSLSHR